VGVVARAVDLPLRLRVHALDLAAQAAERVGGLGAVLAELTFQLLHLGHERGDRPVQRLPVVRHRLIDMRQRLQVAVESLVRRRALAVEVLELLHQVPCCIFECCHVAPPSVRLQYATSTCCAASLTESTPELSVGMRLASSSNSPASASRWVSMPSL